jgi:hypothetical protein
MKFPQTRFLEKPGMSFFDLYRINVHVGRQSKGDIDLGYKGIDIGLISLSRHRYPVISVLDKVHLTDLVQINRRQRNIMVMGFAYVDPPLACLALNRQKCPIKISIAADTAHNLVERYGLQADVALALERQGLSDFVVGQ